jgi:hypothetical protein
MNMNFDEMQLSEQSLDVLKRMQKQLNVNEDWSQLPKSQMVTVKEALTTQDAQILIPRVITGMMREAAEPLYIGSSMLQQVRLTEGRSIEFPSIGAMRAHDIGESQSYLEETVDFQLHKTQEVKVGKSGMVVRVTDEMIADSQWDVIGILVRKAGEAMARLKEEKIFHNFSKHGHIVYDNSIREKYTDAGTNGKAENGVDNNNTLSTEDMIDMMIAVMANGFTPTDIIMHPLCWSVFLKNDLLDRMQYAALGGSQVTNLSVTPYQVSGRIPFNINISLSPFAPFDYENKLFDMHVVDRNNVGILLVKDPLMTEQFDDPMRDIQTIKVKERYGIGILNEGKAIAVARNIAFGQSYPKAQAMRLVP